MLSYCSYFFEKECTRDIFGDHYCKMSFPSDVWSSNGLHLSLSHSLFPDYKLLSPHTSEKCRIHYMEMFTCSCWAQYNRGGEKKISSHPCDGMKFTCWYLQIQDRQFKAWIEFNFFFFAKYFLLLINLNKKNQNFNLTILSLQTSLNHTLKFPLINARSLFLSFSIDRIDIICSYHKHKMEYFYRQNHTNSLLITYLKA